MILSGKEIENQVKQGRIEIDPFTSDSLNPNSYDFHLSPKISFYEHKILDAASDNPVRSEIIPEEGLLLQPERIALGMIEERIGSNHYLPMIKGKSSIARLGLFITITAELIDQGAFGCWTLMMHAVQPVRIYPGMAIGQMTFWEVAGEPLLYSGKYADLKEPAASKAWQDLSG